MNSINIFQYQTSKTLKRYWKVGSKLKMSIHSCDPSSKISTIQRDYVLKYSSEEKRKLHSTCIAKLENLNQYSSNEDLIKRVQWKLALCAILLPAFCCYYLVQTTPTQIPFILQKYLPFLL